MPAIITDKFRIHNSEQFKEAFSETSGNTMYLGIGNTSIRNINKSRSRTNNEGSDVSITPADNTNAQFFLMMIYWQLKKLLLQMLLLQYQEETGQQAQLTIFTDTIMEIELQALQQIKQQIVVQQLYMIQVFMY